MKAVILASFISTLVGVSLAQSDQMLNLMLSQQLFRGSSGGGSAGLGASAAGRYPSASGGLSGVSLASLGRGAGAGGGLLGSMGSLMGGTRGLGMGMAMMGNDRMRDLMVCNMMPAQMRQYCMMMAFQ